MSMTHLINNVEALYPRINKTYRFDNAENRSVPCDPLDDGAAYELSFVMNKEQAKELFTAMAEAYKQKREDKWPAQLQMPFTKNDEGMYVGKAKLKGAYGKDVTNKPMQCDARGTELPKDFLLTSGSTINVAVVFVPYNMRDHGVSLRLKGVQVVKYVPIQKTNPFGAVEGFTVGDENPFAPVAGATKEEIEATTDDVFDEEAETPPKKKAKKKATPKPKDKPEDLGAIIDDWDDE
jgi:hypothetical protein